MISDSLTARPLAIALVVFRSGTFLISPVAIGHLLQPPAGRQCAVLGEPFKAAAHLAVEDHSWASFGLTKDTDDCHYMECGALWNRKRHREPILESGICCTTFSKAAIHVPPMCGAAMEGPPRIESRHVGVLCCVEVTNQKVLLPLTSVDPWEASTSPLLRQRTPADPHSGHRSGTLPAVVEVLLRLAV